MNSLRKGPAILRPRRLCPNGCGRYIRDDATGPCAACVRYEPLPTPKPELMTDAYLVSCAEELVRRRDRLVAACSGIDNPVSRS